MIRVSTCKSCGCDNAVYSSRCNNCGDKLYGNSYERWVCPNCNRINMMDNWNCLCGADREFTFTDKFLLFVMLVAFLALALYLIYYLFTSIF